MTDQEAIEKLEGLKMFYSGLRPELANDYAQALDVALRAVSQLRAAKGNAVKYDARLFGSRLQAVLENSGMPDRQLAELTGLTPTTIARYTRGMTDPKISTVAAIANATGTPIGYLMGMCVDIGGQEEK